MKEKISCIVPAYNEGPRIKNVLNILENHPLLSEVIVINDGSKDNTLQEISKFKRIKIITYEKNRGKSYALMRGLLAAKNNRILLVDSDLLYLSKEDISKLIKPITENIADVSISLRKNSLPIYKFAGIDFISGERVFKKGLLGDLKKISRLHGFGFESYMNDRIISQKQRIAVVNWKNVVSPRKSVKFGFFPGLIGDLKMTLQIIKTVGFIGMFVIFFKMRKLVAN